MRWFCVQNPFYFCAPVEIGEMMRFPRCAWQSLSFLFFSTSLMMGQQARLMRPVESSRFVELKGSVPGAARRSTDLGPLKDEAEPLHLSLRFNLSTAQQQALSQLLRDQQDPKSDRYHQWLTPEQFRAQFGMSQADIQKISDWLVEQGFEITSVARGGLFLRFRGTADQVSRAFHTQLHSVTMGGERHFTNLSAPQLPAEIASVTAAITGLHDFKLKHGSRTIHARKQSLLNPSALVPAVTATDGFNHGVAPGDFYTIYNEKPLLAQGIDGSGVSIAIVGQSDLDFSDIDDFRAAGGLPPNTPEQVLYGPDPGIDTVDAWEVEAVIDLSWAGATAPKAKLIYANGKDILTDSLTGAIDDNLAPIISMSAGDCESDAGYFDQSTVNAYYPLLQMANAQGQTIVAITGDWGATTCDYYAPIATHGYIVAFPASSPLVTAVGGTQFNEGAGIYWRDTTGYWSTTNGSDGTSALSYIPEEAWNESDFYGLLSTGGGRSRYFAKPYWQTGNGVPGDFARDIPDVSLLAGGQETYVVCFAGSCANGYLTVLGNLSYGGIGTSFSTPAFAGILALIEQKTGQRLGNANPTLYALGNSSYASSVFHDITVGSNASICQAGSTDCPYGGSIGYLAGPGYDLATGWGSVDVTQLVNSWSLVTPPAPPTGNMLSTTELSAQSTVTQGTSLPLTATVATASGGAVPSGTVQFLVDHVAVGTAVALSGTTASYTLDTTHISGGDHVLQAAYSGDTNFAGSLGTFAVHVDSTVARAASTTTLTLSPSTLNRGETTIVTAMLVGQAGTVPTGSVRFSVNGTDLNQPATLLRGGQASFSLDTTFLTAPYGESPVKATYLGDANYAGSEGTSTITLTNPWNPADFTLTSSMSSITMHAGDSANIGISLHGLNGFSGTVQLTLNSTYASLSPVSFSITPGQPDAESTLKLRVYKVDTASSVRTLAWPNLASGIAFAGFLVLILRKRRPMPNLLALAFLLTLTSISGCSGAGSGGNNSAGGGGSTNIPPGTYPLTISATGTSGATTVTHTTTVTMVVQ